MFLLFLSLTLSLIRVLKPSFSMHILVLLSFSFLLLDMVVELGFCHSPFTACQSYLAIIFFTMNAKNSNL